MRLALAYSHNAPNGGIVYEIGLCADDGVTRLENTPENQAFLSSQQDRIETMAKRLLGDSFYRLTDNTITHGTLNLRVAIGTTSNESRFAFKDFVGWLKCYLLEHTASW
jgi:hypothetical protein